ncbi:integrin beta-like protein A [Ruditapes philippinarum]|uniref:integrin beta-like protein A n=1 Tax=Ruditapes philippinarum TaxID=129788 RepID=UPI00295B9136|nr:integrin beta-like protein A [Ruditapes philippinarum]
MPVTRIFCFIFLVLFRLSSANHFRGGTISWSSTGKPNEVEFTFKLGWILGRGPGCNENLIGKYVNDSNNGEWVCSKGCEPTNDKLSDVYYYCTAASKAQNWEQGENSFKYTFPNQGPFTVEFAGGNWITLSYGDGDAWNISTVVDLRSRNDTGRPNMSPVASGKPVYSMKYGCTNTIKLPVMDQDGDKITCRWSVGDECASVCKSLPFAMIDPDTCSLTVSAKHTRNGWFAVAITIEDSPNQALSLNGSVLTEDDVISSVPMQFLINTPDIPSRSCSDKPVFVTPTPPENQLYILTPGEKLTITCYATSKGTRITSFELTAPPGVRKSSIQSVPGRPNVYKIVVTWVPKQENKGQHALCIEATDYFGISSDSHCLKVVAWDIDPCKSSPCQNGGNCTRTGFTDNFVCTCVPGYTDLLCQTDINECASDPCLNNGTCFDLINEFFCGCVAGFTGLQCETEINECSNMSCLNGGTCEDLIGKGVCHCLPSFTGKLCQTGIDFCKSLPCLNDGTCYSNLTGYTCSCVDDWHGTNCAFRDEPANNTSILLMANEHMHYSDCKCLLGNERRQICYPYNQRKGIGFGILGVVLGISTSVLLYILFEGVFGKGLTCLQDVYHKTPARPKLNTSAYPDIFNRYNDNCKSNEAVNDYKFEEKNCGHITNTFLSRGTYHSRHCWACREKIEQANNPAPAPTHTFLRKYSGLKRILKKE